MTVRACLRRRSRWLTLGLAIACPVALAAPTPTAGAQYVEGTAHATANGALAYTEAHYRYQADGYNRELVLYRCANGKPFARKLSEQDGSAQAPDFLLDDDRSGYQEGVRGQGGKRVIFMRPSRGAVEQTAALQNSPTLVIDGGFDAYVRQQWDRLQPDGKAIFNFVVPARLKTMSFTLERQPDAVVEGRAARLYRLSLNSMLSFVLPHIDVAYDAQSGQLLQFDGITNIHDASGKNLRANVSFDPRHNARVSQADLQAALAEPLVARCAVR